MNGASGEECASTNSPPIITKTNKTGASQSFLLCFRNFRNSFKNDMGGLDIA